MLDEADHPLVLINNPPPGCAGQLHCLEKGTIPNTSATRQIKCQPVTMSSHFSFIPNIVFIHADGNCLDT